MTWKLKRTLAVNLTGLICLALTLALLSAAPALAEHKKMTPEEFQSLQATHRIGKVDLPCIQCCQGCTGPSCHGGYIMVGVSEYCNGDMDMQASWGSNDVGFNGYHDYHSERHYRNGQLCCFQERVGHCRPRYEKN